MDLSVYPRVDINHIRPGMLVIYDPDVGSTHYAMQPGTTAVVTSPTADPFGDGYYFIEFTDPQLPSTPPRNGQSDGPYHMRDFRVVVASVPKFTTTSQAQAWLDQHSGE